MIISENIGGRYFNYVPDPVSQEYILKVCLSGVNWMCWWCGDTGLYWEHKDDNLRKMWPTFNEWRSLTPDQKKAKSEAFWVFVNGWWEPR